MCDFQQQQDDSADHFIIDDIPKAEWAVKKIIGYQNTIEQRKLAAIEMKQEPLEHIKRIDAWLDDEIADIQKHIDSLSAMLLPFVAEQVEGKKKRSIDLPSGRAGFKKGTTTFFFADSKADKDNQALLQYCVNHNLNDFIKTQINKSVDWANLKKSLHVSDNGKVVTSDGEIIDNMRAEQAPDSFAVVPLKNN